MYTMAEEARDEIYQMLSESGYSDKAIDYFQKKENVGILENANQITDVTGPCGDSMKISLNILDDRIDDAKIQVLGCPGAVASGCAVVSLAKGKSLEEAKRLDLDALYKELEKLPKQKIHCARLALKSLQKAVEQFEEKYNGNGSGKEA
jgi:nitrogen fixation protein NifU and related proteins